MKAMRLLGSLLPCVLVGCGVNQAPLSAQAGLPTAQGVPRPTAVVVAEPVAPQPKDAYGVRMKALLEAADKGQVSRVLEVLGTGADINDKDDQGETALMRAVSKGHGALVTVLLLRGAEITEKDSKGKTAVMRAAENGNVPILKTLLTANTLLKAPQDALKAIGVDVKLPSVPFKNLPLGTVDVDARDQAGQTALFYAVRGGHGEAAAALLGVSASAQLTDADGNTPLMAAAASGQVQVIKQLVHQWGATQTAVNSKTGKTVLMLAAAQGDAECVKHLVENYARFHGFKPDQTMTQLVWVDRQDNAGKTALQYAEEKGHQIAAEYLREYTGLNRPDARGWTRLMQAAAAGDTKTVQTLTRLKADQQMRDADGHDALMLAAASGHSESVFALLEASGTSRDARLEYLERKDRNGKTAAQLALDNKHAELAGHLKDFAEIETADAEGLTPLMAAAQKGDRKTVLRLLAFGANLHAKDNQKRTALMLAAAKGDPEIIWYLVYKLPTDAEKADYVMLKDREGRTALMYAAEEGQGEAIKALFKAVDWPRTSHGTSTYCNLQDKKSRTARSIAKEKGFADLQQLLDKY